MTVLDFMRSEPVVLMELMSEQYGFQREIERINKEIAANPYKVTQEDLDAYYLSPAVRRAVWRTLKIVREIITILGGIPERVFIEFAREKQESKRTVSRKNKLLSLYMDSEEFREIKSELEKRNEDEFQSRRLYLYYLQGGRCLYSGDQIDLARLSGPEYDIDHIYPRSQTKDDSLNNLALVKQEENRKKGNRYPLDPNIQLKCSSLWASLRAQGLLSQEKLNRLIRSHPLTDEELKAFINRQLVETRQSTKAVASLLRRVLNQSKAKIIYVKAGKVSDFRYRDGADDTVTTQFFFPKVRDLNDYHHAKDAYLNIVVGNCYDVKFTKAFFERYREGRDRYNLVRMFDSNIPLNGQDAGSAWIPGSEGSIATVKKTMARNNILVTRFAALITSGFFDQMPLSAIYYEDSKLFRDGQHPLKTKDSRFSNIARYGAYNKIAGAHFALIKHRKNKRYLLTIVRVPIFLMLGAQYDEKLIRYSELEGFVDVEVICSRIKYGETLVLNGMKYSIKSKNGNDYTIRHHVAPNYTSELERFFYDINRSLRRSEDWLLTRRDLIWSKESVDATFKELNCRLINAYDGLVERMMRPPFALVVTLRNLSARLIECKKRYNDLKILEKMTVLNALTQLMTGKGESVDLTLLGLKKQTGILTISPNISLDASLHLLNESITGFFVSRHVLVGESK